MRGLLTGLSTWAGIARGTAAVLLGDEGLQLCSEVLDVSGVGRLLEDVLDDGEVVVEGPHGGLGRT